MANGRGGARSGAGRPKGAKNKLTQAKKATISEIAGQYTETALATLAEIMESREAPAAARVTAANSLLDRAHGKPVPAVPDDDGDEAASLTIRLSAAKAVGDVRVTRSDG